MISATCRTLLCTGILLAASSHAMACRVAPAEQLIDPATQLAQARDVVVARVTDATPSRGVDVPVTFTIIQRLAGASTGNFVITGAVQEDAPATIRADHAQPAFWERGGGRLMVSPDCAIHPTFVMGATYLVFRDEPVNRRSYERIATDSFGRADPADRWLAYVTAALRARP